MSEARPEGRRWQAWLAFSAALLAYVGLAWRAVSAIGRVDWEALASTARAYQAAYATGSLNLALIGFADPPLPALLQVPLIYANEAWATEGLAAGLLSAVVGAVAVAVVWKLLEEVGLGPVATWGLLVVFAANPVWLAACTTGSQMALVGLFAGIAALAALRWVRDGALRDLVILALAASAAPMAAFEACALPVAALLIVVVILWRRRRPGSEVEGTLVTLLLPIAYVMGLWLFASWLILGDPLYFAHHMARLDVAWRLTVVELALCTALLACSWLAVGWRPGRLAAGALCVLLLVTIVAAGTSTEPGQPRLAHGYGFLRSTVGAGDAAALKLIARQTLATCGRKRVLVDSPVDFGVRLLSGHPQSFVRIGELRRALAAGQQPPQLVSYVLGQGQTVSADVRALLFGHRLVPVWRQGSWRLYELRRVR